MDITKPQLSTEILRHKRNAIIAATGLLLLSSFDLTIDFDWIKTNQGTPKALVELVLFLVMAHEIVVLIWKLGGDLTFEMHKRNYDEISTYITRYNDQMTTEIATIQSRHVRNSDNFHDTVDEVDHFKQMIEQYSLKLKISFSILYFSVIILDLVLPVMIAMFATASYIGWMDFSWLLGSQEIIPADTDLTRLNTRSSITL